MSKRLLLSHLITSFFHFPLLSLSFLSSSLLSLHSNLCKQEGKIFKLFITCNFLSFKFVSCRCSLIFLSSPIHSPRARYSSSPSSSQPAPTVLHSVSPLPNQPQLSYTLSLLFFEPLNSLASWLQGNKRERERENCWNERIMLQHFPGVISWIGEREKGRERKDKEREERMRGREKRGQILRNKTYHRNFPLSNVCVLLCFKLSSSHGLTLQVWMIVPKITFTHSPYSGHSWVDTLSPPCIHSSVSGFYEESNFSSLSLSLLVHLPSHWLLLFYERTIEELPGGGISLSLSLSLCFLSFSLTLSLSLSSSTGNQVSECARARLLIEVHIKNRKKDSFDSFTDFSDSQPPHCLLVTQSPMSSHTRSLICFSPLSLSHLCLSSLSPSL